MPCPTCHHPLFEMQPGLKDLTLDERRSLQELIDMPGWKVYLVLLRSRLVEEQNCLLECDEARLLGHRERVKALIERLSFDQNLPELAVGWGNPGPQDDQDPELGGNDHDRT